MSQPVTQRLVAAYAAGTATPAETAAVRAWLAQPANQLLAQHWMRQHWDALANALGDAPGAEAAGSGAGPRLTFRQGDFADAPDYEALLARIRQQLELNSVPAAPRRWAAPTWTTWTRWAAAAALVVSAAGGWLYSHRPTTTAAPALSVATPYGQTRTLTLPDSSRVTLNADSRLRYTTAWAADQPREVWLDGEGFFDVRHQATNQRFLVHTQAGLQVEVLGTRFVVARRRGQTRVVLLTGRVRVEFEDRQQPDVLLRPGELLETHDEQPRQLVHQRVPVEPYAAWKDGRLVLDNTTIAELATRLRDTYGLDVVVASPALNRRRVTGSVPVSELNTLLQALEETFHLRAIRVGNRLTLTEKP